MIDFHNEIVNFRDFGKETVVLSHEFEDQTIPVYVNEYWTSRQRQGHSLHEVSYRACFKPQLPLFFIQRFTRPGDVVYDPFMGRGTTLLEATLHQRVALGCDINPLSAILCGPRLRPPHPDDIFQRLTEIDLTKKSEIWDDLLVFYHPDTLQQICALRDYFLEKQQAGTLDEADAWLRMVATNRLSGHSPGFFSVYSLPPNQAVSIASQQRINSKRNQVPPQRDVKKIIARKSNQLLGDLGEIDRMQHRRTGELGKIITGNCSSVPTVADGTVSLAITSPPFLDIVQYDQDNWLRCWFNGIDSKKVEIWQWRKPADWQNAMAGVFREMYRILKPGGIVAFEVGEIRKGKIVMEDLVIPIASAAGFHIECVMINSQVFTKTSNCWGVDNLSKGTNTNRIIVMRK